MKHSFKWHCGISRPVRTRSALLNLPHLLGSPSNLNQKVHQKTSASASASFTSSSTNKGLACHSAIDGSQKNIICGPSHTTLQRAVRLR